MKHSSAFTTVVLAFTTLPAAGFPPAPADNKDERIAFTTVISNGKEGKRVVIAVMNPDGSNRTVLTTGEAFESDPVLSPDGRRVAFIDVTPGGDQKTDLYVMNANGSQRKKLTGHAIATYVCGMSWSPDGKKLVYGRSLEGRGEQPDDDEIVVIDADGKNATIIGKGVEPAWSPDGKKILYTTQFNLPKEKEPHLAVMDADGKNAKKLMNMPALLGAWSPDGKKIAYVGMGRTAKELGNNYLNNHSLGLIV